MPHQQQKRRGFDHLQSVTPNKHRLRDTARESRWALGEVGERTRPRPGGLNAGVSSPTYLADVGHIRKAAAARAMSP